MNRFTRRDFLRAAGVSLALPLLEAMRVPARASGSNVSRRRMVSIMTPLGIHSENLFPEKGGTDYEPSLYLQQLQPLRQKFTVFSGLSHPGVDGGHDAERSFLTAAPHPGLSSFRNTISLDQFAAERLAGETRFSSLTLATMGTGSISWTRGGVQIPSESRASKLFAKLFLDGTAKEIDQQIGQLRQGRSVLDVVNEQAKRYAGGLGQRDRDKLDEYFTSVRELEGKLTQSEEWARKPKPKVDARPPIDIQDNADLIGRTRMMYDLMHLALQTDSTRLITLQLQGTGLVVPIEGVTAGHHELSHHGKDPEKLRQLALVEAAEFAALGEFLTKLESTREAEGTLLDGSMVFFGSNLGNASSHDNRNMPVFLAGGGFRHGQHLAFDPAKPPALGNLYVQMLQQMGLEVEQFATGQGGIPGFTAQG